MLIDDIIYKIDEGGPRSYYSFETFILNLLKYHLESQNKSLSTNLAQNEVGDAYAPEGFDNFDGPTLIDIKFSSHTPVRHMVERFINKFNRNDTKREVANYLIIFAKSLPKKSEKFLRHEIISFNSNVKFFIWGPEEINSIVSKHRKKSNEIVNKLFSLRLESAVKRDYRDWVEEREERVEMLKELYNKGQFSLFLGAGVSSSAGVPDWNTLLNSLFVSFLTKEFDGDSAISDDDIAELVQRLNDIEEPSALMAARYLRKGLTKSKAAVEEFAETITKNLYKLRDTKYPLNSSLIEGIASMCMPKRTGAKVRSVISYNFDDLIERKLATQSIVYKSIFTENHSYDPEELPVYHVHGFLPEDRSKYDSLDKSTLVFSEEGYHQIYSEAYHWSNLVQLNNLRENCCLMIGLSMTDPNLRRLLDISARNTEYTKHFAFMKRISSKSFCYEIDQATGEKNKAITNTKSADDFLNRHHRLNEELMKELGVKIIWYEKYEEISEILKDIIK